MYCKPGKNSIKKSDKPLKIRKLSGFMKKMETVCGFSESRTKNGGNVKCRKSIMDVPRPAGGPFAIDRPVPNVV